MTAPAAPSAPANPAWQRYLDREHAARDAYLATVKAAHREYLAGPWPDRAAYNVVETAAWATYYQAGRAAWRAWRQEDTPPPDTRPPLEPASHPYPVPPPAAPAPSLPRPTGDSGHYRPGGYLPDADGPRPAQPAFTPHPETEP